MADTKNAPVAEAQPTAPPAPTDGQTPAPPAPEPPKAGPESESGDDKATIEQGAQAVLKIAEQIHKPEVADLLWSSVPEEVREKTRAHKDALGRGEQRGRRLAQNDTEMRQKDVDAQADVKRQVTDAESALNSSDEMDAVTRTRHTKALKSASEEARDLSRKEESFGVITRSPDYDDYTDDDIARCKAVDGKPWSTWFREHLEVALDVRGRREFERGREDAEQSRKAEQALEETVASGERPPAPARTGPGAPAGGMTWESFNALPLDEQAKVTPSERARIYAEHDARTART